MLLKLGCRGVDRAWRDQRFLNANHARRLSRIWHRFDKDFEKQVEEILVPMVVAELRFVEIERKLAGADAVVLEQFAFGITPKTFQPVDVHLPRCTRSAE